MTVGGRNSPAPCGASSPASGIEGATVRRVAEQAGVSMGGLRHHFDNQQGQWAQHLHVLVDGLTLQAVTYPGRLSADDLRAAVRRQLALVASDPQPGT